MPGEVNPVPSARKDRMSQPKADQLRAKRFTHRT